MDGRMLTYATLYDEDACEEQRELFSEHFQKEVFVTVEVAVAQAGDWDWQWAAENLLSQEGYEAYKAAERPALQAYNDTMAPTWAAIGPARREAHEAGARVRHAYSNPHSEEAWDAAHMAQAAIMEPVYEAERKTLNEQGLRLNQVRAKAWAELYIKEGNESSGS